jgi:DNA-binding transcriptional regulator YiaG
VSNLADRVRAGQLPMPVVRKRIRESANVSLRVMATELGVSVMSMSRWESGGTTPTLDNAIAYRKLLDDLPQAVQPPQ